METRDFWTFIAAAFAGYFALQKTGTNPSDLQSFIVICLGFMFSLGWYLVNRGSKFWQQNWESHVDALEDEVMGPLHKTILQPGEYSWFHLSGAYPYSPSKLNQILSLFVTAMWACLMVRGIATEIDAKWPNAYPFIATIALTGAFAAALLLFGKTSNIGRAVKIKHRTRMPDFS